MQGLEFPSNILTAEGLPMPYPLIDIGKLPGEPSMATLGFALPANTPFGNFQRKWMDMVERLDEANRQIIISYQTWDGFSSGRAFQLGPHLYAVEYAVAGMRRVADEFVALMSCLTHLIKTGEYPTKIKLEKIGSALPEREVGPDNLFLKHRSLLRILNDISNTFKHSFLQSDLGLIGADEPRINALELKRADLKHEPVFYSLKLSELVSSYNAFFLDCRAWLCNNGRPQD